MILTSSSLIDGHTLVQPYRKNSSWLGLLAWTVVLLKAEARAKEVSSRYNDPTGEVWQAIKDAELEAVSDSFEENLLRGRMLFAISD